MNTRVAWIGGPDAAFHPFHGLGDALHAGSRLELHAEVQENLLRSEMNAHHADQLQHRIIVGHDLPDRLFELFRDRLAHQQGPGFVAEEHGHARQDDPDHDRGGPVQHRQVERPRQEHAEKRDHDSDQRREILRHGYEHARVLAHAQPLPEAPAAVLSAQLTERHAQRHALDDERHPEDRVDPDRIPGDFRAAQMLESFVHAESASEPEQDHRDDQAPEVQLLAVSERVAGIGRLVTSPVAEQEERLVAGIGHRVDALGQHRRTSGDRGCRELRHGDHRVGDHRSDYGFRASTGHISSFFAVR